MKSLTLILFCIAGFFYAQGQHNYTQAIQQGNDAFNKKQYKTAINKYFAAEAFEPTKKDEVKVKVNLAFDAIEALRNKAEIALQDKLKSDEARNMALRAQNMAVLAQRQTQMEKEKIDSNLQLIRNTNKLLARKLMGLSDSVDSTTKEIFIYVQEVLAGTIQVDEKSKNQDYHYYPITTDQLKAIAGKSTNLMPAIAEWLTNTCPKYGIDNKEIYAHFLAQAIFETDGFAILREMGSDDDLDKRYGPQSRMATILGNTEPGDGAKFRGRGIIMLTGRKAYLQWGFLYGDSDKFINNPELLEQPEYAVWAACEYWKNRGLVEMADNKGPATLTAITKKINGGTNGLAQREKLYDIALQVLR